MVTCGYEFKILLFSGVSATNDTLLAILVCSLTTLELADLTIGAFFRTYCYCVVPRYDSVRMRYESDRIGRDWSVGFSMLDVSAQRWTVPADGRVRC